MLAHSSERYPRKFASDPCEILRLAEVVDKDFSCDRGRILVENEMLEVFLRADQSLAEMWDWMEENKALALRFGVDEHMKDLLLLRVILLKGIM